MEGQSEQDGEGGLQTVEPREPQGPQEPAAVQGTEGPEVPVDRARPEERRQESVHLGWAEGCLPGVAAVRGAGRAPPNPAGARRS